MAKKEICTDKALLDFAMPADYDTVSQFLDIFSERYDFISIQSIGETILGRRIQIAGGRGGAEKRYVCRNPSWNGVDYNAVPASLYQ